MSILRIAALALAFSLTLGVTPAAAQDAQPDQGAGFGEAVRGFFKRLFGSGEPVAPGPAREQDEPLPVPPAAHQPQAGEQMPPAAQATSAPTFTKTPTYSQALHASIVRGDTLTTLKLIEQGADIEAKDPGAGASPLHYAVMTGRMPIIELLLQRGADAKSIARNGSAPLHTAVRHHRLEVAELLIEHGAEVNVKDASGMTPLGLAVAMRNEPLSALLRGRGGK